MPIYIVEEKNNGNAHKKGENEMKKSAMETFENFMFLLPKVMVAGAITGVTLFILRGWGWV